jgi:cell division protein FtsB
MTIKLTKTTFLAAIVVVLLVVVLSMVFESRKGDSALSKRAVDSISQPLENDQSIVVEVDNITQAQFNQLAAEQQRIKHHMDALQNSTENALNEIKELITGLSQPEPAMLAESSTQNTTTAQEPNIDKAEREERFRGLKNQVLTQDFDPSWSEGANQDIRNAAAGEIFEGSHVVVAECRSTHCLINVDHADQQAMEKFISSFPSKLGWDQSAGEIQVVDEGGQLQTHFVITRPGYEMDGNKGT